MLRERGWLTSKASIYGGFGKPSILARAQSGGYVTGDGKLTERGLDVTNPDRLIARQGVLSGSEEHKNLMRKTMLMIQDNGNFAFTLNDKDAFDVGEIKAAAKNAWNLEQLQIYECQTNAIREEVEKCVARAVQYNASLVFVVQNKEVGEKIGKSTRGIYEAALRQN